MAIFGGVAHQSLNLQGLEVAFIASNRIQEMACLMEWEHTDHLNLLKTPTLLFKCPPELLKSHQECSLFQSYNIYC